MHGDIQGYAREHYAHVSVCVCIYVCIVEVFIRTRKYTHSYLSAQPFANLCTKSRVARVQALTLPLTNSQLDSSPQGQELCPQPSEFCPLPLVEFPSNCSTDIS